MYYWRIWLVAGVTYIMLNAVFGYLHCMDNFCPGDRESDWVYEYTDDDGKRMIMTDGAVVPKEQWIIDQKGNIR
jgi:hypothetical protein